MNLDDQEKLKFDRRLENRRGWLQPGEHEAHLEGLADATDKIHDGSEDEVEAEAAAGEAAPAGQPTAPAGAPLVSSPDSPPGSATVAPPGSTPGTPEGGLGSA